MEIHTGRLSLMLLKETTRDDFFRLYQCPKVMRNIGEPLSDEYLARTFRNALLWNEHTSFKQKVWEIRELRNSDFVGIFLVKVACESGEIFEVGIMLSPEKSKQGYAVEALGSAINYLHINKSFGRFVGKVHRENISASKMLESLNFFRTDSNEALVLYEMRKNRVSAR